MKPPDPDRADRLSSLRAAFDGAFAAPPPGAPPELEGLISIRCAGDRFALRVSELSGIERAGKVVPLPRAAPELLGLAGVRGRLTPVYGLAALLGAAATDSARRGAEARWLALFGSPEEPVGLLFDEMGGCVHLPRESLRPESQGSAGELVGAVARIGGAVVPVLSVAAILAAIRGRAKVGVR